MSLLSVYDDVVIVGKEGSLSGQRTSCDLAPYRTLLLSLSKCILGRRDGSAGMNMMASEYSETLRKHGY